MVHACGAEHRCAKCQNSSFKPANSGSAMPSIRARSHDHRRQCLGLAFLIAEGAVLSAQGIQGVAYALIAVFVASTVSSIAGFAFSALCGALLFHLMDSPVYAVHVMIVCSIAIQLLSVAALWRSIDWRSLRIFLVGGVLGVPAGVYLLLHLPTATLSGYHRRSADRSMAVICCCAGLSARFGLGPLSDACAGFLGGLTGGLAGFPGAFVTIWCGLKGWDKARQRGVYQPFILCMQPVTLIAIYLMRPSSSTAGATGLEGARLRSGCLARRVVRIAHLQAALGPAVRARRQRVAHSVRHRPHSLSRSRTPASSSR